MRNSLIKLISTFFYIGYLPSMSGTYASIAGMLLVFFAGKSIYAQIMLAILLIVLGLLVAGRAERILSRGKDPGCIVIDEVAGMSLSLLFLPRDLRVFVLAFLIFRLLDIIKPYPADRFHAKIGSIGVMGDDIVAGIYTNVIIQALLRLAVFNAS